MFRANGSKFELQLTCFPNFSHFKIVFFKDKCFVSVKKKNSELIRISIFTRVWCSSYLSLPSQARIKQLHISPADTRQSANTVIEIAGGSHSGQ